MVPPPARNCLILFFPLWGGGSTNFLFGPYSPYPGQNLDIIFTFIYLGVRICPAYKYDVGKSLTSENVESGMEFREWDHVLEKVDTFIYLGSILSFDNRNWPVVA